MDQKLELIMQAYHIEVIKEEGTNPLTHQPTPPQSERFQVEAKTLDEAYQAALIRCSIRFNGETRRTFIDGQEYTSSKS